MKCLNLAIECIKILNVLCWLHEWKLISLKYIQRTFGNNFKFHFNLHVLSRLFCNFPSFYKSIITFWSISYSFPPTVPSAISSEYLWFNTFMKIESCLNVVQITE